MKPLHRMFALRSVVAVMVLACASGCQSTAADRYAPEPARQWAGAVERLDLWRTILEADGAQRAGAVRELQAVAAAPGAMAELLLLDADRDARSDAFDLLERHADQITQASVELSHVLRAIAHNGDPPERQRAAALLERLPDPTDESEWGFDRFPLRNPSGIEDRIWALSSMPVTDDAAKQLVALLDSPRPEEQFHAANSLARVAPRHAAVVVPALVDLLGRHAPARPSVQTRVDGTTYTRRSRSPYSPGGMLADAVAWALLEYGSASIDPLIKVLPTWSDPAARENGVVVLGLMAERHPHPSIMRALRDRLRDGDPETRMAAAHSLGRIGDPGVATPALVEATRDADVRVRRAALSSLGSARGGSRDRVIPVLRAALADPDVGRVAALSLADAGDVSMLLAEVGSPEYWRAGYALNALARLLGSHGPPRGFRLAYDEPRPPMPAFMVDLLCHALGRPEVFVLECAARVVSAWCRAGTSDASADPYGWFRAGREQPGDVSPLVDALIRALERDAGFSGSARCAAAALADIGHDAIGALDCLVARLRVSAGGKDGYSLLQQIAAFGPPGISRLEAEEQAGRLPEGTVARCGGIESPVRALAIAAERSGNWAAVARLARLGELPADRVAGWLIAALRLHPSAASTGAAALAVLGHSAPWPELPPGARALPPGISASVRVEAIRALTASLESAYGWERNQIVVTIGELGRDGSARASVPAIRRLPGSIHVQSQIELRGAMVPKNVLIELLGACPISFR